VGVKLKHIKVIPLAAESLGVRSMCTYVETPDVGVLLDAGVSLCPIRFGLPPHPEEFKAIDLCRKRIAKTAERAQIVTISHYHFDHHTPSFEDWLCNWTETEETSKQIYNEKIVLAKDPRKQINPSQRRRGWLFKRTNGKFIKRLEYADRRTFKFRKHTMVRFSEPVFHGIKSSGLGWVIMTTIEYKGEKFVFTSDVQGPMNSKTLELILKEDPQTIMIGGPPLYLAEFRVKEENIQKGLKNLETIVENVPYTILDHHILRDEDWMGKTEKVFNAARENGNRVLTAAEFSGKNNTLLEATRKQLFDKKPPSKEFKKWMRKSEEKKKHIKPPLSLQNSRALKLKDA
jgi:hypothetical protein